MLTAIYSMGAGSGQTPPIDQEVPPARTRAMTMGPRHGSLSAAVNPGNRPKIELPLAAFRRA